jgi:hypothetical protein
VLFPFAVFLVAAWSAADDDIVALPVLVVSGSFVLQTHLGFAVLVPGLALLSLGLLWWRLRYDRRRGAATDSSRRLHRAWGLLALGVGLVCWALPLYEQISGRYGGNLGSLIGAAASPRDSNPFEAAVRIVGGTVALPPWWLPPSFASPAVDPSGDGVSLAWAVAGLGVLVAVLAIALLRAVRRQRTTIATGLGLALATIPLAVYTAWRAPTAPPWVTVIYLRGLWVVSAFVGMIVVLAVADEVRHRRPPPPAGSVMAPTVVAAVTLAAGLLAIPHADRGADPTSSGAPTPVAATHSLAGQVLPAVRERGTVLVEMGYPWAMRIRSARACSSSCTKRACRSSSAIPRWCASWATTGPTTGATPLCA